MNKTNKKSTTLYFGKNRPARKSVQKKKDVIKEQAEGFDLKQKKLKQEALLRMNK